MPVPDPLLDAGRLAAVRELALTDAPQQEVFTSLSRLAGRLLGVPVSVVSIISADRQIHAGQAGLFEDTTSHSEWPLSHSFCQQVARSGQALIVSDARQDPSLADNLSIRDHKVIAYAGLPLRLRGGEVVGAFCAIDHEPRQWSGEQLTILKDLTAVAITLLDQRRSGAGAAMHDLITGLPRQPLFAEHLTELLASATLEERVSVVAVNIADFKLVNRALGHQAGDAILAEVGLRLQQLANAGRRHGRVTRLAADTFLLAAAVGRGEPRGHLEEEVLRAVIGRPVQIEGQGHALGARVATITATPQSTAAELIHTASESIDTARLLDASDHVDPSSAQGPARRQLMIRNRLYGAERRGELSLHYQPLYDLATLRPDGLEALVRWDHPELGSVPPDEFISIAESCGAIVPIGEWVLQTALADLARWRQTHHALGLSVNVAPEQLLVPSFVDQVSQALLGSGVPAGALTLEITERTLGRDQPAMQQALTALRALGVQLSLDDFGTGYSSLRRLTGSPLDELKLDRTFIAALQTDRRCQAVLAGIAAMSSALGMRVVAEGIETRGQLDILAAIGITHGQGYLLARPAPAGDIAAALDQATAAGTLAAVAGETEAIAAS